MLVLTVGLVFIGVTGVKIAQNGSSMRHVDFLITVASLSLWAFLLVACVLGLYATWRDHLEPFTIFCFAFFCHWALDLASTMAFLVVAYKRSTPRVRFAWSVD